MLDRSGDSQEGLTTGSSSLCNDRPTVGADRTGREEDVLLQSGEYKQTRWRRRALKQARTANTSLLVHSGAATVVHFDGDAFRK